MARQIRRLKPSVREIAAEVEGYRHRATGKSPHGLCVESMFYLAMGATQLSYAIICAASEPMQWYADNYFKSLSAWRPFYEQYVAFNRGTEPGGIDPYIGPDHALRDTEAGEPSFAWSVAGSGDMIYDMATLGLPFCPDGNHSSALIMDASAVQGLARRGGCPAFRLPGHPARPGGMGTGTAAQTRYAAYGRSGSRRTRRSRVHDLRERRQDGSRSFVQRRRQQCRKTESAAHRRLAFGREASRRSWRRWLRPPSCPGSTRRRTCVPSCCSTAVSRNRIRSGSACADVRRRRKRLPSGKSGTTGRNPASPVRRHGCGSFPIPLWKAGMSAGWPSNSIAARAEDDPQKPDRLSGELGYLCGRFLRLNIRTMKYLREILLCVVLTAACSVATLRGGDSLSLKIMIYNLRFGEKASLEELAEAIRAQRPDLVALLQEIDCRTRAAGRPAPARQRLRDGVGPADRHVPALRENHTPCRRVVRNRHTDRRTVHQRAKADAAAGIRDRGTPGVAARHDRGRRRHDRFRLDPSVAERAEPSDASRVHRPGNRKSAFPRAPRRRFQRRTERSGNRDDDPERERCCATGSPPSRPTGPKSGSTTCSVSRPGNGGWNRLGSFLRNFPTIGRSFRSLRRYGERGKSPGTLFGSGFALETCRHRHLNVNRVETVKTE